MKKKLLCGILAALMLTSAVACTGNGDVTETTDAGIDTVVTLPQTEAPTDAPTEAPTEAVTEPGPILLPKPSLPLRSRFPLTRTLD